MAEGTNVGSVNIAIIGDDSDFNKKMDGVEDRAEEAAENVEGSFEKAGEGVGNAFSSAMNKFKNKLNVLGKNKAGRALTNLFPTLKKAAIGVGIAKLIGDTIMLAKGFSLLRKAARAATGAIQNGFTQLKSTLLSFGREGFGNLTRATGETKRNAEQLQASLLMLKNALGSAFAPIFNYIAPALNTLISGLAAAANAVAKFMAALTGKSFATVAQKSFEGIGDSATAAGGAVGELQRQLMGFDQINKLEDNSGGGGGGGGGINYGDMFDTVEIDETTNKWADYIKQSWENANFFGVGLIIGSKINEALNSIDWGPIHETATRIGTSIATLLVGVLTATDWGLVGRTIGNGLNTALYLADAFLTNFDFTLFGQSIGQAISGAMEAFDWTTFGHTVSILMFSGLNVISGFIQGFDWQSFPQHVVDFLAGIDWAYVASSIFQFIGSALGAIKGLEKGIGKAIMGGIVNAITAARDYFKQKIEECGGNVLLGILKGIIDGIKGIASWIKKNIFDPFIKGFKKAFGISSPSKEMKKMGGFLVDGLLDGIKDLWDKAKKIFEGFKTSMENFFKDPIGTIKTAFADTKESLANKWNAIVGGVTDKTANVRAQFESKASLASKWAEATSGISDIVKTVSGKVKDLTYDGTLDIKKAVVHNIEAPSNGILVGGGWSAWTQVGGVTPSLKGGTTTAAGDMDSLRLLLENAQSNNETIINILTQILVWLNTYDKDIYLDGQSIKDRVVRLINNNTIATGMCEIRI